MRRLLKGQYELVELVGEGGLAWVYAAKDHTTGTSVAVKILRPEVIRNNPETLRRFEREAEILKRLRHPNIVQFYDQGHELGLYFIVLEYVDGVALRQYIDKHGPLTISRAMQLARQVAGALCRAEEIGIVHRDIKPQNVIIDRYHWVKLTDFGIARVQSISNVTSAGMILGTPQYLSPEQARGEQVDIRSDIFSLGTTLYEALTGRALFHGDTPATVIYRLLNDDPPPLARFEQEKQSGGLVAVDELLGRCLAKDSRKRYQTPRDLVVAVDAIIAQLPREGDGDSILEQLLMQLEGGDKHSRPSAGTRGTRERPDLSTPSSALGRKHGEVSSRVGDRSEFRQVGQGALVSSGGANKATITIRSTVAGVGPRVITIGAEEVRIGRLDLAHKIKPDIDLTEENPTRTIHRRHARIYYRAGTWYLVAEPGAEDATLVNGRALQMDRPTVLTSGDSIRLSRVVELVFRLER